VEAVLEEAKRYVLGERAQGTLDLDDDEDEEEYDHDPLASDNTEPLPMGDVGKPAKKKKTKSE
jgi:hypothetical protein